MRVTWRTELPQWLLLLGMFILAAITWPSAPDRIPVHWNAVGQVDRYGGKLEGLLILPLTALGIYLLLLFLPRIDPGRVNYQRFAGSYTTIRLSVVTLLAVIYGVTLLSIRGVQVNMGLIVPMLVGGLLIVLGNLMGKIRPNWFVGIRTPWTLSSKRSWTKTHRMGGWVFIAMGLAMMAIGLVRVEWAVWSLMGGVLAGVVWLFVYSYLVWRSDPDKLPPSGTLPG